MLNLPNYILYVLDTLESAGYEAYVVGGAVRDMLMEQVPNDFDITTSCPPEIVCDLFEKTIKTGFQHGTVTVIADGKPIEITTFREDIGYSNFRKPDSVKFGNNLHEDLKRRDFTINAISLSRNFEIKDIFEGIKDIKNKTIRAIGNPDERFTEDALRILRAFRFSAKLGFKIEESTYNSAIKNAFLLQNISRERIFSEFSQILISDNPEHVEPLINCGALNFIGVKNSQNLKLLQRLPKRLDIRFFTFCLLSNSDSKALSTHLKTNKKLFKYCELMKKLHSQEFSLERTNIKRFLNLSNQEIFTDFLLIKQATENIAIQDILNTVNNIIVLNEPYKISDLTISGNDILALGCSPERVGTVLNYLLSVVMHDANKNDKDILISLAVAFLKNKFTL